MRSLMLVAGFAVVAAAAVAPLHGAHAQAIPNITAAKRVANGAAAAANAHTAAVNGTATNGTASGAAPASATQRAPESAKPGAKPGVKPGARSAARPAATPAGKAATPAAGKAATPTVAAASAAAATARDTAKRGSSTSVATRGAAGEMTFLREVYAYPATGRRDPFLSLLKSGDLRPLLSDLKLVTVLYDPTGRNSVAILRDLSTKDQYRVKVGQQIGRMRVAQIQPKQLVLTIEEFGYSRQETLGLNSDTTSARTR